MLEFIVLTYRLNTSVSFASYDAVIFVVVMATILMTLQSEVEQCCHLKW
jgi:hypothetical protein